MAGEGGRGRNCEEAGPSGIAMPGGVRQHRSGFGLQNRDHVCGYDQGFVLGALVGGELAVVGEVGEIVDLGLRVGVGTEGHEATSGLGGQGSADGVEQAVEHIGASQHDEQYTISWPRSKVEALSTKTNGAGE